jgi:hypothetical protein
MRYLVDWAHLLRVVGGQDPLEREGHLGPGRQAETELHLVQSPHLEKIVAVHLGVFGLRGAEPIHLGAGVHAFHLRGRLRETAVSKSLSPAYEISPAGTGRTGTIPEDA